MSLRNPRTFEWHISYCMAQEYIVPFIEYIVNSLNILNGTVICSQGCWLCCIWALPRAAARGKKKSPKQPYILFGPVSDMLINCNTRIYHYLPWLRSISGCNRQLPWRYNWHIWHVDRLRLLLVPSLASLSGSLLRWWLRASCPMIKVSQSWRQDMAGLSLWPKFYDLYTSVWHCMANIGKSCNINIINHAWNQSRGKQSSVSERKTMEKHPRRRKNKLPCFMVCQARAEAMQRWVDDEQMAAIAVFGLEEEQLKGLCASVDPGSNMSALGHWTCFQLSMVVWLFWGLYYLERPNPGKFHGGAQYLGYSLRPRVFPDWAIFQVETTLRRGMFPKCSN